MACKWRSTTSKRSTCRRVRAVIINTRLGEMDDGALMAPLRSILENDDQRVEMIEYCVLGCEGHAHVTGVAQGDGCFCELHVHRSVHVTVKTGFEVTGETASLV
jgi:hypothetical protein